MKLFLLSFLFCFSINAYDINHLVANQTLKLLNQNHQNKNNLSNIYTSDFTNNQILIPTIDYSILKKQLYFFKDLTLATDINFDLIYDNLFINYIFGAFNQTQYNQIDATNFKSIRLINIINDDLTSVNISDQTSFDEFYNEYFKSTYDLNYNNELGIVNVKLYLKPNKSFRYIPWDNFRTYNENKQTDPNNFKPIKKYSTSPQEYIEFNITNFNNKYTIITNENPIDANNSPIANYNANQIDINLVLDYLCQFEDSPTLLDNKKILVSNYTKQEFIVKYKPQLIVNNITSASTNLKAQIKLDLFNPEFNQPQTYSTNDYYSINNPVIDFEVFNLKTDIIFEQTGGTNYDVSVSKEVWDMTTIDFASDETTFRRNVMKLINFKDDKTLLKHPLFTTNLSEREFLTILKPTFKIGEINDIDGTINQCNLTIYQPLGNINNNDKYVALSYNFNLSNFKQNIILNQYDQKIFDVSNNSILSSINASLFNQEYLLRNLIHYQNDNLVTENSSYLLATNLDQTNFSRLIDKIEISNVDNITGQLELKIIFNDNRALNGLKELNYRLVGFLQSVNIYQTTKTFDKKVIKDLEQLNPLLVNNNQLVDNEQIKEQTKSIIANNISNLFLFNADKAVDNKIFSINTSEEYFVNNLIDLNQIMVEIQANLGIIKIKIPLLKTKGISLNEALINKTYLEFNINGYHQGFSKQLVNNKLMLNRQSLGLNNDVNVIDSDFIYQTCFQFLAKNQVNNQNILLKTSLSLNEFVDNFVNSIIIDASDELGLVDVIINLVDGFIENTNSLNVTFYNFTRVGTIPLNLNYVSKLDISQFDQYKNLYSYDFNWSILKTMIGFNGVIKTYNILTFDFSENLFDKFILNRYEINKDGSTCNVKLYLNKENNQTQLYQFELNGFLEESNWWIILISVLIPAIVITAIVIFLVLYLRRRKIKNEILKENNMW